MFRIIIYTVTISFILSGCFKNIPEGQASVKGEDKLIGVYDFISETTVLSKPRKSAFKRISPEWTGTWQFQNGHYTRVLMKGRRDTFFDFKRLEDLGFESFAGPYEFEGARVRLIQKYAVHPFAVDRSALMDFRIDGDNLTLIQTLHPYLEDPREGTITVVLRRLK